MVLTSSTISKLGEMYLRGWCSHRRSRQEVAQFIWNACGLKKNSILSSVGKQDNSLFDIHPLISMTVLFSGWWNIPYLLKNPGGFIKFFMIRVQRLFLSGIFTKGSVYLKSNLFLANNSMVTDHFNFKKQKHNLVLV